MFKLTKSSSEDFIWVLISFTWGIFFYIVLTGDIFYTDAGGYTYAGYAWGLFVIIVYLCGSLFISKVCRKLGIVPDCKAHCFCKSDARWTSRECCNCFYVEVKPTYCKHCFCILKQNGNGCCDFCNEDKWGIEFCNAEMERKDVSAQICYYCLKYLGNYDQR